MFFKSILLGSSVVGFSAIRFVFEDYLIEKNTEKANEKETFSVVEKSNEQDIVYRDFLQKIENLNKNIKALKGKNLDMLGKLEILKNQLEINNNHQESVIVEKEAKINACKDEIERIKRHITSNEESINSSIVTNLEKKEVFDDELIKLKTTKKEHTLKTNEKAKLDQELSSKNLEKTELLQKIKDLETLIQNFESQLIPIKREYKENKDKIAEYLKKTKTLKNANEELNLQRQLKQDEIKNFEFEIKKAEREIFIKTEAYNALKIESDLINEKLSKTITAEKKEESKKTELIEQKNTLQLKRKTLVSRISELEVYKRSINVDASTLKSEISEINQLLKTEKQKNTEIKIVNQQLLNNTRLINSRLNELKTKKQLLEDFINTSNSGGDEKILKTTEVESIANIESEIKTLEENSQKLSNEKNKLTEEKQKIEKLIKEYKQETQKDLSNFDLTKKYQLQKSWIPEFEYDLNEISYFVLLSEAKLENFPIQKAKFKKLKTLLTPLKNDHDFLNKSIMILKSKYDGLLIKIKGAEEGTQYEPTKDEKESILQSINSADIFSKFFKEKLNQIKTELKEFANQFTSLGEKIQFDFEFIEKEILGLEEDQKKWEKFKEEFAIETQEYDDLFDMATLLKKIVNKKQKQVKELESKRTEIGANISIIQNTKNNKRETTLSENFDSWYEKLFSLRSLLTTTRKEYSDSMIKVFEDLSLLESDDYFVEFRIQRTKLAKKKKSKIELSMASYSLENQWVPKNFIKLDQKKIYLLSVFDNSRSNNEELGFVPLALENLKSESKTLWNKSMKTYSFNIHAAIDDVSIVFDKAKPNNTKSNIKIGVASNCDEFESNIQTLIQKTAVINATRQELIKHLETSSNVSEVFIKNELSIIHQIEADELKTMSW